MNHSFPEMAANGRRDELSQGQLRALAALVTTPTLTEAAKKAGVGERTIRRWLTEDGRFVAQYRVMRRRVVEEASGSMQAAMTQAVEVLVGLLESENEHVRFKAATGILDYGFQIADDDLTERVEALEAVARHGGDMPW